MKWKDRLTVAVCIFLMISCGLFIGGWVLNSTGIRNLDLQILLRGIEVVLKLLEFLLGGSL